jgi:hypothetical protein
MVWRVQTANNLPTDERLVVARTTLLLTVCAFVALAVELYIRTDFIPTLVTFFIFALCTTHTYYASVKNLTQAQVRKIDYWYLGAATIGLFMFTVGYSEQRDAAVTRSSEYAYQQRKVEFQTEVANALIAYKNETCKNEFKRLISDQTCAVGEVIAKEITPDISPDLIGHFLYRLKKARIEVIKRGQNVSFERVNKRVEQSLIFLKTLKENVPKKNNVHTDEEVGLWFSFGQYVIWPFLLAYALALRITKVTADVFEWAK